MSRSDRYGREEMLALFVEETDVPDELHRAPSLVSEIVQIPLALRASVEHSQSQVSWQELCKQQALFSVASIKGDFSSENVYYPSSSCFRITQSRGIYL